MLMLLSVEVILILMMILMMMMMVMMMMVLVLVVVVAVMTVMDACGDKTGHLWEIQKLFKNLICFTPQQKHHCGWFCQCAMDFLELQSHSDDTVNGPRVGS